MLPSRPALGFYQMVQTVPASLSHLNGIWSHLAGAAVLETGAWAHHPHPAGIIRICSWYPLSEDVSIDFVNLRGMLTSLPFESAFGLLGAHRGPFLVLGFPSQPLTAMFM